MEAYEFVIGIGACFGMAFIASTAVETVTGSVEKYMFQRGIYRYRQKDPQLLLFSGLYEKPSFMKILGQETRGIFRLGKKKKLEENLD